jgi:hypothetical protein
LGKGHGKGLSGAEAVEGKRWQPIHADSPTPSSSHRVNAKGLVSGKNQQKWAGFVNRPSHPSENQHNSLGKFLLFCCGS